MPKSPFLKRNKPAKILSLKNRQKQKFAIWDYYKNKSNSDKSAFKPKKPQ